jgi:hypothetical protein
MFIYRYTLLLIALFFIGANTGAYWFFADFFATHQGVWFSIVTFEIVVMFVVAQFSLLSPIIKLKKEIALFLTGGKR